MDTTVAKVEGEAPDRRARSVRRLGNPILAVLGMAAVGCGMQPPWGTRAEVLWRAEPEPGHARPIRDFDWAPDGKHLATASEEDQTIRLWNLESGVEDRVFHLPGEIEHLRYFNSSDVLAVAAYRDHRPELRLLRLEDGYSKRVARAYILRRMFAATNAPLIGLGPDGRQQAEIWDLRTMTSTRLPGGIEDIRGPVAIDAEGLFLVLPPERDKQGFRVFDISTRKVVRTETAEAMCFSPDARRFVVRVTLRSTEEDPGIELRETLTGQPIPLGIPPAIAGRSPEACALSRDAETMVLALNAPGDNLIVWRSADASTARAFAGGSENLHISPDGRYLGIVNNATLRLTDLAASKTSVAARDLPERERIANNLVMSDDGALVSSLSTSGWLRTRDAHTGERRCEARIEGWDVKEIQFVPDAHRVIVFMGRRLQEWDADRCVPTGAAFDFNLRGDDWVEAFALGRRGGLAVAKAAWNTTARAWALEVVVYDRSTRAVRRTFAWPYAKGFKPDATGMAFSPDERSIVATTATGRILFDLTADGSPQMIPGNLFDESLYWPEYWPVFATMGDTAAMVEQGYRNRIHLWDPNTGRPKFRQLSSSGFGPPSFSPDGRWVCVPGVQFEDAGCHRIDGSDGLVRVDSLFIVTGPAPGVESRTDGTFVLIAMLKDGSLEASVVRTGRWLPAASLIFTCLSLIGFVGGILVGRKQAREWSYPPSQ